MKPTDFSLYTFKKATKQSINGIEWKNVFRYLTKGIYYDIIYKIRKLI